MNEFVNGCNKRLKCKKCDATEEVPEKRGRGKHRISGGICETLLKDSESDLARENERGDDRY